jgi:hypothetical protein
MDKVGCPKSPTADRSKVFDRPVSSDRLERHLAALDVISNVVGGGGNVDNDTQENLGFRHPLLTKRFFPTFRSTTIPSQRNTPTHKCINFQQNKTSLQKVKS